MRVGSLFSGIGGLELGLERAGMSVAWQCEIDAYCRSVLAHHWPGLVIYDDIRSIDESAERVDLICGGFPCQPVSLAGKGLAQEDPRWLWPEFARVVGLLRPRYVLVENVPGLVRRGLADVVGDLAALGYDAEWQVVSAASVGAPHLRERLVVVAYPDGERSAQRRVSEGEGEPRVPHASGGRGLCPDPCRQGDRRDDPAGLRAALAYPDGFGRVRRESLEGAGGHTAQRSETSHHAGDGGDPRGAAPLADANGLLLDWGRDFGQGRRPELADGGWWLTEPEVGRVAHGVPGRVAQLRALGNAVVPQVAEFVGRLILEAEAARSAAQA